MKIRIVLANGAVIELDGLVVGNTVDQYPGIVEFNITQLLRLIVELSKPRQSPAEPKKEEK